MEKIRELLRNWMEEPEAKQAQGTHPKQEAHQHERDRHHGS